MLHVTRRRTFYISPFIVVAVVADDDAVVAVDVPVVVAAAVVVVNVVAVAADVIRVSSIFFSKHFHPFLSLKPFPHNAENV